MEQDKKTLYVTAAVVTVVVVVVVAAVTLLMTRDSGSDADPAGAASGASAGATVGTTSMTVGPGNGSTSTMTAGPTAGEAPDEVQPSQAPGDDPGSATAEEVAQRVATIVMSWQPAVDPSRGAAGKRAEPWLTGPALAEAQAYAGTPQGLRPDQLWTVWRSQKAVITANAAEVKTVASSGTSARVAVKLRQVAIADYVPASVAGVWTVTCDLTKTAQGWKVSKYTLTEGA